MKKLILSLCLISSSAFAGGDPASLKLKVLAVYASLSAQCTNPIQVFLNNSGDYVDFLRSPTLGGGDLPDGTYNCLIIKMSDLIKHTPLVTNSTCIAGTEYTAGVCHAGQFADDIAGGIGNITCHGDGTSTGSVEDNVYMYLTTDAAASTGNNAFNHPVTPGDGKGIKLGAPLVISSTSRAKFVVNATGKVTPGGGDCGMNPPTFTFVNY
jgi:hypothetical protein